MSRPLKLNPKFTLEKVGTLRERNHEVVEKFKNYIENTKDLRVEA
jgi:hypothetical protein